MKKLPKQLKLQISSKSVFQASAPQAVGYWQFILFMTILVFDQATKCTGYSVWVDGQLQNYGIIEVDDKTLTSIERIRAMREKCIDIAERYRPEMICIEGVQYQNNQAVYSQLSQLQGAIMTIAFDKDIALYIIPPTVWKGHCEIKGKKRAEQKENTIKMVRNLYGLEVSEDIADSIGIGRYVAETLILENTKENN